MGMQLSGSLELTGSFTTSGAIVAQTLVVQTITSSITQMTGSNIFGSSLSNIQQMTGSLRVTGSITQTGANLTSSFSGVLGVGTTSSPLGSKLVVSGAIESLTDPAGEGGQLTLRGNTFQYGIDNYLGGGIRFIRENDGTGAAGAVLMFISGSGNVGIGNATPQGTFHVGSNLTSGGDAAAITLKQTSTTATSGIYLERSGEQKGYYMYVGGSVDSLTFQRNNAGTKADVMSLTRDGNVGIGTSSPSQKLDIVTSGSSPSIRVGDGTTTIYLGIATIANDYANGTSAGDIVLRGSTGIAFTPNNGTTTAMRITSGGNVLIGTTDSAARLVVRGSSTSGSDFALWVTDSVGSLALGVRNDTLIRTPGTYSYSYASTANVFVQSDGYLGRNTSSLKYKKNVEDYTRGLADVLKLRPVLYESKNPSEADKKFTGFIAEEIHELGLTEFVQYAEDGTPDALQYPHFVALLAAAIKELSAKVAALENR